MLTLPGASFVYSFPTQLAELAELTLPSLLILYTLRTCVRFAQCRQGCLRSSGRLPGAHAPGCIFCVLFFLRNSLNLPYSLNSLNSPNSPNSLNSLNLLCRRLLRRIVFVGFDLLDLGQVALSVAVHKQKPLVRVEHPDQTVVREMVSKVSFRVFEEIDIFGSRRFEARNQLFDRGQFLLWLDRFRCIKF